ncbi:MAG: ATP-binding protein [Aquabacterium sp.]
MTASNETAERRERPRDQVRDQVRELHDQTPASLVGNLIGWAVLFAMYRGEAPAQVLWGWTALQLGLWVARAVLYWRWPGEQADMVVLRRWRGWWYGLLLGTAFGWAAAVWSFYGLGDSFHTLGLILVVYSYCLGAVALLASQFPIYLAFLTMVLVPTIARIVVDRASPYHLELAGILTLLFLVTAVTGRSYRRAFEHAVELKQRTETLLGQLRHEKSAADEARRDAETANRAKTQFFAAASHDLRQPLHALGLFAEALRGKVQDESVVNLVNSINSSVDALEGLFSELLDITRIDTGGVDVRPVDFTLEEVFRKVRLHFEPVAFEKGLALTLRGGRHAVHADPVLVERVVRNLVSNAIRYTDDGGVLVGARRRGAQVVLQVWDSGRGIPQADQDRVFEEFVQLDVQVGDGTSHHRKGLGLGLSIVRRLAALMNAPLSLRSRVGHGTVFMMELPLGRPPRADAPPTSMRANPMLTLDRQLIVVVEDDAAVKGGLEVLLKSWGASVIGFDTLAACRQWAAAAEPAMLKPSLLIADYRLENGASGIQAIELMRSVFQPDLPAIIVTGSTLSDLEAAAHTHGFHLLIKPVVPNRLRAMIAFKLNVR